METSHESANASQFKIFDNMLEGVSVYKLINDKGKVIDGILKYMNPVTVKMMGLNPDEFIGKNVLEFLDPCFIKPYLDVTNEFRVTGKYKRFEVYYPPTDKYFIVSGFDMSNNLFAVLRTDVTQQKKAEKALRQEVSRTSKILKELKENEQRFKSLFEHSNDAIIIADLKTGKFVDINKKTEELTGYSKEELPYMAVGDLASDSMKKEDIKQFNLTKHRPCRIETELSRKDGRVIPIELTIAVIEIDNKKYAQGVVRDISELKKAEGHFHKEVKRESFLLELYKKSPQLSDKELYERALDHAVSLTDSSIGFFHLISDDQKNIILDTWNKKALSTCKAPFKTHYPIEQAGNWTDCVPAKGPVVYNDFKNSPNRKGYPEGHVNVKRFISVPVFDEDKVKFIFGVGNKIEEYDGHDVIQIQSVANELYKIIKQRHWEQALKEAHDNLEKKVKERTYELENAYGLLKESEEKFRLIFNEAEDSIVLNEMMENGLPRKIIEANNTTSKRLRYTREELLNMSPLEIVAPEKRVEMSKNVEQLRKNGHVIFETIHMAKDGRRIPVEVNNHLTEFKGKETALTIVRDITNRKEMEKRLKETIQKLERSNKELQQFAYVSSHDLQEPLRTIASFTQLMERRYRGKLDSDADEFMDYIVDAAVRMKQQIQDLLEYSRVTTAGGEFRLVDTNSTLNQVIANLKSSIDENNAKITCDPLPDVIADDDQLIRVFQNIIGNAIKYRKPDETPKVHISCQIDKENNEYVFSVYDNGIGIEEQYSDRIFRIFQRLHTREEYQGTGIGLAVVKRVIERHGGQIWVESKPGKGSVFYFSIPSSNGK